MEEEFPKGWDRVARIFSSQPPPDHPEFFTERVMEEIRRPEPVRSRPAWWWVPALAPGLAFFLFLLALAGSHSRVSGSALLEASFTRSDSRPGPQRPATGMLLELLRGEAS